MSGKVDDRQFISLSATKLLRGGSFVQLRSLLKVVVKLLKHKVCKKMTVDVGELLARLQSRDSGLCLNLYSRIFGIPHSD